MTRAELKCRDLWRQCVKYRDRWCQICGAPGLLEAHHIWFLSSGNWQVQFDVDFGAALCFDCHQTREYAPHINNELFLEKFLPRIDQDRAAKISKFLNIQKSEDRNQKTEDRLSSRPPCSVPCTEHPDYAEIAAKLQLQLREFKSLYYMNHDIEPYARGASI